MGSYSIYPNLYVIMVGPPGVIRKSTTAAYSEHLLGGLSNVKLSSTAVSDSKLVEILSETPDGAISIISSEFATFVNVSQESMYDLLTDLFDGKVKHELATRLHGIEIAENPCLNLLAATTPTWVSNQMPSHVIGGGFASRVVFVFENRVRQRKLYYDLDWGHYELLKDQLTRDLIHIGGLEGEFNHDSKRTKDLMEQWYQETDDTVGDSRIEGYYQRKHIHVHKVAMLLSLAERDDFIITEVHFEAAKAILEGVESKMPRVFSAVGANPTAGYLEEVLDYIALQREPIHRSKIQRRFHHNLDAARLGEVLAALVSMDYIIDVSGPNTFLKDAQYIARD